ncbi:hypothetical protein BT69DRAFT_989039 [Atractiella rhizophila]|nr:hypothetical protein BT69DRAFT_989039 [Atractiella rhizophila]
MATPVRRSISPNSSSEQLPSYSDSSNDSRESETSNSSATTSPSATQTSQVILPPSFRIGKYEVAPVVDVDQLRAHLRLLGAFYKLREEKVKGTEVIDSIDVFPSFDPVAAATLMEGLDKGFTRVPPEVTWGIYLSQAVGRFELWYHKVVCDPDGTLGNKRLPPLDVLMVWHAYLLNPKAYFEDSLLRWEKLAELKGIDVKQIAQFIDEDTSNYDPFSEATSTWTALTGEPFEATIPKPSDAHTFICPNCAVTQSTPYCNSQQTGWAQSFSFSCSCGIIVKKEKFGMLILSKTISEYLKFNERRTSVPKGGVRPTIPASACIANSLIGTDGMPDTAKAEKVNDRWMRYFVKGFDSRLPPKDIIAGQVIRWSMTNVEKLFNASILGSASSRLPTPKPVFRVLNAYRQPFASIDLAAAVNRQFSFVKQCVEQLQWTKPHRFDHDASILLRSVARYSAFLDLMQSSPASFCVPTLDIDLSWHSHQLRDQDYREQTLKYVGLVPNHDDKVDENTLSTSFDVTARAWKERFGVPYSTCGCMLPEDSLSSKLKNKLRRSKSVNAADSSSADNLIHSSNIEESTSTHPSDHNSIRLVNHPKSDLARANRERMRQKQIAKEEKAIREGKADEWARGRKEARERNHRNAFYADNYPAGGAYWGVNYMPLGIGFGYGYGLAGCGGVAEGWGGNSTGACAAGSGANCGAGGAGGCGAGGSACGGAVGACAGGAAGSCGGSGGGCGGGGCGGGGN